MRVLKHRVSGLVTVTELAQRMGRSINTVYSWQRVGVFPFPTHTVEGGRRAYYTQEEADELVGKWARDLDNRST